MRPSSTPIIPGPARGAIAGGVLLLLVVAAGCGGRETIASKSAAEFDRAQEKGGTAATAGGAHGGHGGQQPQAATADAKDSAEMATMDHSNMPGMKPPGPARTQGGAIAGMDHSNMPGMKPAGGARTQGGAMAGMDHSNMPGMKPAGPGRTESGTMAGMDHASMPGMAMAPPVPERPSISAQPGQPAATLRLGNLDGAAATSVRDAARSAAIAQEMGGGHGGMVHGTYSQTDAGRGEVPITSPAASPSAPDPHAGHRMPAPRPTPSPSPAPKENR